jgi:signal peptide peptidase SppA
MIEPAWFAQAVAAVRDGTLKPRQVTEGETVAQQQAAEADEGGIAMIGIHGQMTKGRSSFDDGTSTVETRIAIRKAVRDEQVKAILLHIDSPGGTVAGTADLADEIAGADRRKPVYAYIEDLGASAAYWVASQARRITANRTALVGSIGTLSVLEDLSGMAEAAGVKVHVIATGAYKGAFVEGTEITEDHLAYAQEVVDDLNAPFLKAVKGGRQMTAKQVREAADGRVHIAKKALAFGLIDGVESLDDTVRAMRKVIKEQETPRADRAGRRLRSARASYVDSR